MIRIFSLCVVYIVNLLSPNCQYQLVFIFSMQKIIVIFVFLISRDEKQHFKLPKNIDDAKNLGKVLSRYKDSYYNQVLGGYFITYILYPYMSW
jgi:hypothetical protein